MPYKDKEKQRQAQNEWVKRHREQVKKSVQRARRERLEYIHSFKRMPCADCRNEYDPCAMDFHHREGEEKLARLARMANDRATYEAIDAEIAKCDILCAVCHRLRHKDSNPL